MSLMRADGGPHWLAEHRAEIHHRLVTDGRVLIRGLDVDDRDDAAAVVRALGDEPMVEREGFAPRAEHGAGLYSSSEWPPDEPMCMHNELSYRDVVPGRLAFVCLTPPASGGVTAVADTRAVLADLPAEVRRRFERSGWRLRRTYGALVGVRWQDAFGTDDRAAVDDYCRAHGIAARWDADGTLRTEQRRPSVVRHPVTGERCWFNQIAFLSEWTMAPEVREFLIGQFGPDGLPFTTTDGDGAPLDRATVDQINDVYEKHTVREPWQRGDVLVLDNILTAHSRETYRGAREVVVGLLAPVRVVGT
ncbi:TauD/TfdA family dioxygenase [Micromonospora sp. NBS 11-29]|uniref:TauD/TfdA family dioxygenase n=1 Tax=Micromonospora sp. NBS 11-29 TaxID=1960879 RepID=UPI000B798FA8|nr:TauD/TfdA family dioxygenase [Micromonospora sp. NBS 11-29]